MSAGAAVLERLGKEVRAVIPPAVFFLVTLNLIAIIRWLMLKGTGVPVSSPLEVTVAALIIGKAVLVADHLPIINRYPDHPLIYNVAWKTTIYVLVSMVVHYLERLLDVARQVGGIVAGNRELLAGMVWSRFWGIQIILALLIFMYCTMRELIRVIGPEKVRAIFFEYPKGARG